MPGPLPHRGAGHPNRNMVLMTVITTSVPLLRGRPRGRRNVAAGLALIPAGLIVLVVYVGCMLWTITLILFVLWVTYENVSQLNTIFGNE